MGQRPVETRAQSDDVAEQAVTRLSSLEALVAHHLVFYGCNENARASCFSPKLLHDGFVAQFPIVQPT